MKKMYFTLVAIFISCCSYAQISGTTTLCIGSTSALTDPSLGGGPSGWTSSNTSVATIDSATGVVTAISAGTATIGNWGPAYTATPVVVTVNPNPPAMTINPNPVCLGSTATVSDAVTMGIWSSSSPAVASVSGTGLLTGIIAGTATISYVVSSTGCLTTSVVTVNTAPTAITGTPIVCPGTNTTLMDLVAGGTWSSSSPNVTVSGAGVVTGVTTGTATVSYSLPTGCSASVVVTVNGFPAPITGPSNICLGLTGVLSDATVGGTWLTSAPAVAPVGSASGIVTGVSTGTTIITYAIPGGCYSIDTITIDAIPAMITGSTQVCGTSTTTLMDVTSGGTWISSSPLTAIIDPATGVVTGIAPGTTTISYELASTCATWTIVTVNALPSITAGSISNCGGTFSITGGGAGTGGTYLWSPSAGLSCAGCATTTASVSSTTTYSVIGTDASGCYGTANVTLNADRVSGYISLTTVPTDTLKVWLVQFNPSDSSLIAEDSTFSCMDSGTPYYEFDSKPAGSYMVKAKLLSSVPGTSGYVPTYGLSSALWSSADMFAHTASATDTMHINMIYGTVPSGPGFIGGLISSGAGRGTSGAVPAVGMLVYLKDATTGTILTYTYTDATGAYSFSGLANGSYTIYPVDYHYYTIPWSGVTLSTSAETAAGVSFYQHTMYGTITPYTTHTPVCCGPTSVAVIDIFPNPAANELNIAWGNQPTGTADLLITDLTGREVYRSVMDIDNPAGSNVLNTSGFDNGIYIITVRSKEINYTNKLTIQH